MINERKKEGKKIVTLYVMDPYFLMSKKKKTLNLALIT